MFSKHFYGVGLMAAVVIPAVLQGCSSDNPLCCSPSEFTPGATVSGGGYAQAAASALLKKTDLSAREIVETALGIAGDICVFTNHNLTIEEQDLAE